MSHQSSSHTHFGFTYSKVKLKPFSCQCYILLYNRFVSSHECNFVLPKTVKT